MKRRPRLEPLGILLLIASSMSSLAGTSFAQETGAQQVDLPEADLTKPGSLKPRGPVGVDVSQAGNKKQTAHELVHRFWDKKNDGLFAGVGASRTLDFFSTLNMRRRGRQEIFLTNDAVDNHMAFVVIEASATGVSIASAYLFHRYGHHKLERWTSILHISLATTGSVRNYCLKTAHFAMATPGSP